MTKPIGAAAYAAIEAAMARLQARIDDPATLTMARLASEAGVSRATLYRAPELLDRFRAALERRNGDDTTALASPDHIGELEAKIAILRDRESDEMHDLRGVGPESNV
jgi:AcrR family transcriptional regulator